MEIEDQKYCVAAEDRQTGQRLALTDGMTYSAATQIKIAYNQKQKKWYKYFHVSKYPYKTKKVK